MFFGLKTALSILNLESRPVWKLNLESLADNSLWNLNPGPPLQGPWLWNPKIPIWKGVKSQNPNFKRVKSKNPMLWGPVFVLLNWDIRICLLIQGLLGAVNYHLNIPILIRTGIRKSQFHTWFLKSQFQKEWNPKIPIFSPGIPKSRIGLLGPTCEQVTLALWATHAIHIFRSITFWFQAFCCCTSHFAILKEYG